MGRDRTSHELGHQLQSIPDTLARLALPRKMVIGLLAKTIGFEITRYSKCLTLEIYYCDCKSSKK